MRKQKTWLLSIVLAVVLYSCGDNKSRLLTKDWKATELTLGETKLQADAVGGIYFSFKTDSSFSYTETGNVETGKWSLNKEGDKITLNFTEGSRTVVQSVKELTAEKLVVDYEDHGMKRSMVLVSVSK